MEDLGFSLDRGALGKRLGLRVLGLEFPCYVSLSPVYQHYSNFI